MRPATCPTPHRARAEASRSWSRFLDRFVGCLVSRSVDHTVGHSVGRSVGKLAARVPALPGPLPQPTRLRARLLGTVLAATLVTGPVAARDLIVRTEAGSVKVTEVASGLQSPWALAFLPDGRMLVTERPGQMRIVGRDGRVSAPIAGVPRTSPARGGSSAA